MHFTWESADSLQNTAPGDLTCSEAVGPKCRDCLYLYR
uniref:Uncharacterized protein n=1 Tax=Anguilla anguilla TaxID=7936 RepID=A0A0E9UVJ0_ANGAN